MYGEKSRAGRKSNMGRNTNAGVFAMVGNG